MTWNYLLEIYVSDYELIQMQRGGLFPLRWDKHLEKRNLLKLTLSDCLSPFLISAGFYFYGPTETSRSLPRTHRRDIAAGFGATVPPKPTSPDGVCSRVGRCAAIFSRERRKWRFPMASSHGVTSHLVRARWSAPGRGSRHWQGANTRGLR